MFVQSPSNKAIICLATDFAAICTQDVRTTVTSTSTIMAVLLLIFATVLSVQIAVAQDVRKSSIPPVITYGNGQETCPSTEQRNIALQKVKDNVYQYLFNGSIVPQCGEGIWYRVAYLNMADSSQQCPPAWRQYSGNQYRACGRPISGSQSSPATFYTTNRQYSKVCGRVIALQFASPDGFHPFNGIDGVYMDGISITYGSPRNHIWTFVGSYSETATSTNTCPCDYRFANQPQSFVGSNYYCESGNPNRSWQSQIYSNDKLWDGEQCSHEGTCCTGTNTPPWFSVNLGSPTSDDIEVRIMGTESTTNEDTPIELVEIYIQ